MNAYFRTGIALGLLLAASAALTGASAQPAATPQMMEDYRNKLAAYKLARQKYEQEAEPYWRLVSEKRAARYAKKRANQQISLSDYILNQPPVYAGPPAPVDPAAPPKPPPRDIPVVADFLRQAEAHFRFKPEPPTSEIEFKRAYATAAAAAGISKDQAVRIYVFEAGGDGGYDVQAGLETPKPEARAVSTALGYNQLLSTNSVSLLAEKGERFILALRAKAESASEPRRAALEQKIASLQRMIAASRTVPVQWSEHERLARTPQGQGIHAINLDIDIGPLVQAQKLMDSINFMRQRKFARPLSAAELEMLNLTGDGNGYDMIIMTDAMREQVPTSNFFQRNGYERNPVASQHNTVAKLIARTDAIMDGEVGAQGAKDLADAFKRP